MATDWPRLLVQAVSMYLDTKDAFTAGANGESDATWDEDCEALRDTYDLALRHLRTIHARCLAAQEPKRPLMIGRFPLDPRNRIVEIGAEDDEAGTPDA